MERIIVGVVRGGPSSHEMSLATGKAMLAHLPSDRFEAHDLYVDHAGVWHERGRPLAAARALRGTDVALIATHIPDGSVERILEQCAIPYQGADPLSTFHASHQIFSREKARGAGLATPLYALLGASEDPELFAVNVVRTFAQPVVVAPVPGIGPEQTFAVAGYAPLLRAITTLRESGHERIMVEEFVRGREVSVAVLEDIRGKELYTPPVVELFERGTRVRVPAPLPRVLAEDVARAGKLMHQSLGLRDYSSSDFVITPKGLFYLRTNPLPPLGPHSLLTHGTESVGIALPDLVTHLVTRALAR